LTTDDTDGRGCDHIPHAKVATVTKVVVGNASPVGLFFVRRGADLPAPLKLIRPARCRAIARSEGGRFGEASQPGRSHVVQPPQAASKPSQAIVQALAESLARSSRFQTAVNQVETN